MSSIDGGWDFPIPRFECMGCKACGDACPVKAISFSVTEEGFWHPEIDGTKCGSCGRCRKSCPFCKESRGETIPLQVFAGWNRNDKVRRKSTSGGIYIALAQEIIRRHGILAGCVYTQGYRAAQHIITGKERDIKRISGSKYFQSDTAGIYRKVAKALQADKIVFFSGTPCQVAALKTYLGYEPENLYTMDFICRGVSSPLLQKAKIDFYEQKGRSEVASYQDKNKKYAWIDFGANIVYRNGKEYFVSRWTDDFLHSFIAKNITMRESCYQCRFKLGHMESDITVGDFWGIQGVTEKDLRDGVSAILVNTEKGKALLERIRDRLYLLPRPIESVKAGNPALYSSPDRPVERSDFYKRLLHGGAESTMRFYRGFRAEATKEIKRHLKRMRRRPLLFLWEDFFKIDLWQFLYYNYFCRQVKREHAAYLIPYKGACIKIAPTARLVLKANVLVNYCPAYARGKREAFFQLRDHARAMIQNRMELAYGTTFSVASGAELRTGYFTAMIGSQIICNYRMRFGNNIMLGRNVILFDSDYHPLLNDCFERINPDQELRIGDNVWIGTDTTVLKGSRIGSGAVIGAGSLVSGEVAEGIISINKRNKGESNLGGRWER